MPSRRPNLTQEQLDEYAAMYAACRGPLRHSWELIVASKEQKPSFGTLALFRCVRCTTERHDIFSRITGELLVRWYVHPENYREAGGHTAAEYRAIWAEGAFDEGALLDADEPKGKKR